MYALMGQTKVCAVFKEASGIHNGSTIRLRPDTNRVRIFDPETGRALR